VAQGSRFGGFSLFVKDGTLTFADNFLGIPPEQRMSAPAPRSGRHIVGVEFTKERVGEHYELIGPAKLHVDDDVVAEQELRTIVAFYALCGEACASATTAATPSARSTRRSSSSGAGRSSRSCSTSPTTPMSTWSNTSPPP
jgi:hypothetical protein